MEYLSKVMIIPILLSSDKIVMSLSHGDQILCLVYITIGNLDSKTRRSQTRSDILVLGFILIVHKRLENGYNKNQYLKAKIYHLALITML